jgi:hypothetical protein
MQTRSVSLKIPEIGLIASTRVVLGVGIGLILSDKLSRDHRKRAGWTLLAIGAATTVPIIMNVFRKAKCSDELAA